MSAPYLLTVSTALTMIAVEIAEAMPSVKKASWSASVCKFKVKAYSSVDVWWETKGPAYNIKHEIDRRRQSTICQETPDRSEES